VLFFDKRPAGTTRATKEIWVYDLRSNMKFSVKQKQIVSADLADFVNCYRAEDRSARKETEHFRRFKYEEIVARDKASLDIQWHHEGITTDEGETPQALIKEILGDLEEAMREFSAAEAAIRR